MIYAHICEKFGITEIKHTEGKKIKRRGKTEIETFKHRLTLLKREWGREPDQLKNIGFQTSRDEFRKCLSIFRKAGRKGRQRSDKASKCSAFHSDPYKFT